MIGIWDYHLKTHFNYAIWFFQHYRYMYINFDYDTEDICILMYVCVD